MPADGAFLGVAGFAAGVRGGGSGRDISAPRPANTITPSFSQRSMQRSTSAGGSAPICRSSATVVSPSIRDSRYPSEGVSVRLAGLQPGASRGSRSAPALDPSFPRRMVLPGPSGE